MTYPSASEVDAQVKDAMSRLPKPFDIDIEDVAEAILDDLFSGMTDDQLRNQCAYIEAALRMREPVPTFIGTRPFQGVYRPTMIYTSFVRFVDLRTQTVLGLLLYERGPQWQYIGPEAFNPELFDD